MRKLIVSLIFLSFLASTGSAHAVIIKVFNISGTLDTSEMGNLSSFRLWLGIDNPAPLGEQYRQNDFNNLVKIQENQVSTDLIQMLQRTFAPTNYDIMGDVAERVSMYQTNRIIGSVEWGGVSNYTLSQLNISPIPDLSAYRISGLYLDNSINQIGPTVDYDIHLLAEAAPVPEPSTILLLGASLTGLLFLRRNSNK